MTWHLPAARRRIHRCSGSFVEHLSWRHTQLQTQRAITVVGVEPIVRGLQDYPRGRKNSFVARPRYLKEDLVLSLELHFLVINASREEHCAIGGQETEQDLLSDIGGGPRSCSDGRDI